MCRHEFLTLKHYGRHALHFMRTQQLERALWYTLAQANLQDKNAFLKGAFLMSKRGQIEQEEIQSLSQINKSIDKIAERVAELVTACSRKSSSKIIAFINQVLFEEMGFQGVADENQSLEHYYIDQVKYIALHNRDNENRPRPYPICISVLIFFYQVLETRRGSRFLLSLIFFEVARRLDITFEMVVLAHNLKTDNFILLRWMEFPEY